MPPRCEKCFQSAREVGVLVAWAALVSASCASDARSVVYVAAGWPVSPVSSLSCEFARIIRWESASRTHLSALRREGRPRAGRHVHMPAATSASSRRPAFPFAVRVRRRCDGRQRPHRLLEQRHQHDDQRVDYDDRMLAHAGRLPSERDGRRRRVPRVGEANGGGDGQRGAGQRRRGDGMRRRRRRRRSQASAPPSTADLLRARLEYRKLVAGRTLVAGRRASSTAGAAVAYPAATAAAESHAGDAVPNGQLVDRLPFVIWR